MITEQLQVTCLRPLQSTQCFEIDSNTLSFVIRYQTHTCTFIIRKKTKRDTKEKRFLNGERTIKKNMR